MGSQYVRQLTHAEYAEYFTYVLGKGFWLKYYELYRKTDLKLFALSYLQLGED